jgi:O-antigen/teichoic acid export membrane protein
MNKSIFKVQQFAKLNNVTTKASFLRALSIGATISGQILIPFVFLRYSTLDNLGTWYVIVSAGTFASLLDLGLIQVMSTASLQKYIIARQDSFKIINALYNYLVIVAISITFVLVLFCSYLIGTDQLKTSDFLFLSCLYFLNISASLLLRFFEAIFRVLGSVVGLQFLVCQAYADLVILCLNLMQHISLFSIVLEMIAVKLSLLGILRIKFQDSSRALKLVNPIKSFPEIKKYLRLGISYLGMPIGYLIVNEVSNLTIAALLGVKTLGVYSILKSISGVFRQITGVFTISLQPRVTELIASQARELARSTFFTIRKNLILVNSIVLLLLLLTYKLLEANFANLQSANFIVYVIFLTSAFIDIWWLIDSMVISAMNAHEGFTVRFLASAILSGITGLILVPYIGLSAMAIATLIIDIIMIPYCKRVRNKLLNF